MIKMSHKSSDKCSAVVSDPIIHRSLTTCTVLYVTIQYYMSLYSTVCHSFTLRVVLSTGNLKFLLFWSFTSYESKVLCFDRHQQLRLKNLFAGIERYIKSGDASIGRGKVTIVSRSYGHTRHRLKSFFTGR